METSGFVFNEASDHSGFLVVGYTGRKKDITIPDKLQYGKVVGIGPHAFQNKPISRVFLPDGVVWVGDEAFSSCPNLEGVRFSNTIQTIGAKAFFGCKLLPSIYLPNSLSEIGDSAFEGCTSLEVVWLQERIRKIGSRAFFGCSEAKILNIPQSLAEVGDGAFSGCYQIDTFWISYQKFLSIAIGEDNGSFSGAAKFSDIRDLGDNEPRSQADLKALKTGDVLFHKDLGPLMFIDYETPEIIRVCDGKGDVRRFSSDVLGKKITARKKKISVSESQGSSAQRENGQISDNAAASGLASRPIFHLDDSQGPEIDDIDIGEVAEGSIKDDGTEKQVLVSKENGGRKQVLLETTYTKVAGATHGDRQSVIMSLIVGQSLELRAEPDNPYDCFAVKILTEDGKEVGYIPSSSNKPYFGALSRGDTLLCTVSDVHGGSGYFYGATIKIEHFSKEDE